MSKDKELYTTPLAEHDFQVFLNDRLANIVQVLGVKAKEYCRNGDRFHNFNQAAITENKTREECIHGMFLKHYISYKDMIEDIKNDKLPSVEYVNEKFGDIINYMILMEIGIKQQIDTAEEVLIKYE